MRQKISHWNIQQTFLGPNSMEYRSNELNHLTSAMHKWKLLPCNQYCQHTFIDFQSLRSQVKNSNPFDNVLSCKFLLFGDMPSIQFGFTLLKREFCVSVPLTFHNFGLSGLKQWNLWREFLIRNSIERKVV